MRGRSWRDLRRWTAWVPELVVLGLVWMAYGLAQRSAPLHVTDAVGRGRALLHAEAAMGLDVERSANAWLVSHPLLATAANYYYAVLHFGATLVVLIWLWCRHRDRYPAARNWLVATNLWGLLVFWLAPTAPPRLLPGEGFVDTVIRFHTWGSWASPQVAKSADQYASIPSLHVAWALWCAGVVAACHASRRTRLLAWSYPVATSAVVVVTGNHYVLDVAAGVLAAAVGWVSAAGVSRSCAALAARARRPWRPATAPVRPAPPPLIDLTQPEGADPRPRRAAGPVAAR